MPKSVLDIAVVAAVLSLVVSVNGDLLTACKANESGIRPPLALVHMRVPPPVSAFIAAVELFFAARNLHDITATMLPQQMILWYQHVCAQHLYRLLVTFFDRLSTPKRRCAIFCAPFPAGYSPFSAGNKKRLSISYL